jgi:hypothetical protein
MLLQVAAQDIGQLTDIGAPTDVNAASRADDRYGWDT